MAILVLDARGHWALPMRRMSGLAHDIGKAWQFALRWGVAASAARIARMDPARHRRRPHGAAAATITVLSLSARDSVWPHLIRTVLPGAHLDTGLLVAGVGVLSLLFGTGTAWHVSLYRFPGRAVGMKELPATLLLRPFNFETLATHVDSMRRRRV